MSLTTYKLINNLLNGGDISPYLDKKNPELKNIDYWQVLGELEDLNATEDYAKLIPMTQIPNKFSSRLSIYESPYRFLKLWLTSPYFTPGITFVFYMEVRDKNNKIFDKIMNRTDLSFDEEIEFFMDTIGDDDFKIGNGKKERLLRIVNDKRFPDSYREQALEYLK